MQLYNITTNMLISKHVYIWTYFESRYSEKTSKWLSISPIGKNMSQKELSVTSGAPLSSIQRFEHTGEESLSSFAKIVRFLGYAKELMEVISKPKYQSIEEMVRINKNKRRKRGTNEKF